MKKLIFILSLFCSSLFAQNNSQSDALGLPGDNLNLYAVLDIFQKSPTLEQFEKSINLEDSKVNNLDLNGDGQIDYIRVIDHQNQNGHAIVLQIAINEKEAQDVAVIEVEKDNNTVVSLQIIGDENLYGKDYILEPGKAKETPNPGYTGGNGNTTVNNVTNNYYSGNDYTYAASEVGGWPIILFMFTPAYIAYHSPYYWGYYPPHWRPWTPWYYDHYREYHHTHYGHYYRGNHYRAPIAHNYYGTRRSSSVTVDTRRKSGAYSNTYKKSDSKPDNKQSNVLKQNNTNKQQPGYNQSKGNKLQPNTNQSKGNNQNSNYNQSKGTNQNSNYNQNKGNNRSNYNQNKGNKQENTYKQGSGNKQQPVNKQSPSNKQKPENKQTPVKNEKKGQDKTTNDGGKRN